MLTTVPSPNRWKESLRNSGKGSPVDAHAVRAGLQVSELRRPVCRSRRPGRATVTSRSIPGPRRQTSPMVACHPRRKEPPRALPGGNGGGTKSSSALAARGAR